MTTKVYSTTGRSIKIGQKVGVQQKGRGQSYDESVSPRGALVQDRSLVKKKPGINVRSVQGTGLGQGEERGGVPGGGAVPLIVRWGRLTGGRAGPARVRGCDRAVATAGGGAGEGPRHDPPSTAKTSRYDHRGGWGVSSGHELFLVKW